MNPVLRDALISFATVLLASIITDWSNQTLVIMYLLYVIYLAVTDMRATLLSKKVKVFEVDGIKSVEEAKALSNNG